jgi:hypothetical protein
MNAAEDTMDRNTLSIAILIISMYGACEENRDIEDVKRLLREGAIHAMAVMAEPYRGIMLEKLASFIEPGFRERVVQESTRYERSVMDHMGL